MQILNAFYVIFFSSLQKSNTLKEIKNIIVCFIVLVIKFLVCIWKKNDNFVTLVVVGKN